MTMILPNNLLFHIGIKIIYQNYKPIGTILPTAGMITAFEEVQQILYTNGIRAQYSNYPDINLKDWEIAYYGENYQPPSKN